MFKRVKQFMYIVKQLIRLGVRQFYKIRYAGTNRLMKINKQELKAPFYLRADTSDIAMYWDIFNDQEYNFITSAQPETIVDAGANIGLASILFANRYPNTKIIAIEAEKSNFELLKKNVLPYKNIIPVHAALWSKNEDISLMDPGLDKCGFMTQDEKENRYGSEIPDKENVTLCHQVHGMTVDRIMQDYQLSKIDILKIDIEGAEKEVFTDTSAWIDSVNAIIIELHEGMKPGCNRSFYNGSDGFDYEWHQGENVYLSREEFLLNSSS